MCKSVSECREAHRNIHRTVNGLEAWIFRSEKFGTYGIMYYAPGTIEPGFSFKSEYDGIFTAAEKL